MARWQDSASSRQSPGTALVLITPADSDLAAPVKALRVANKGSTWLDVTLTSLEGTSLLISFPPGITYEPLAVKRVSSTGTSADANLVIHGYTV